MRISLGATRVQVLVLTLRELLWVTAAGVIVGAPVALAVGRIVGSRMPNVEAFDSMVTVGAILTIAVVSMVADVVPARRAARLDPIRALRHE